MSSFVVENQTINEVISTLAAHRRCGTLLFHNTAKLEIDIDLSTPAGCAKLGTAMFELNCKAFSACYGGRHDDDLKDSAYAYRSTLPNLIQAYKSLQCWLYQCAEGDIPDVSLLYAAMLKIHAEMAHAIVQELAAYDKARW